MNPATHTHTSTPAHSQPTTSCAGRVRAFDDGDRDAALALEVAPNPARRRPGLSSGPRSQSSTTTPTRARSTGWPRVPTASPWRRERMAEVRHSMLGTPQHAWYTTACLVHQHMLSLSCRGSASCQWSFRPVGSSFAGNTVRRTPIILAFAQFHRLSSPLHKPIIRSTVRLD